MDNFKKQIKTHYKNHRLTEQQISKLQGLQKQKWKPIVTWSACAAVPLLVALLVLFIPHQSNLEKITHEVIYNHNKNLPSEFIADNVTDLNLKLQKLDFKIQPFYNMEQFAVLGGRYCSIQGAIAAQVKLNRNGSTITIFQSKFLDVNRSKLPFFTTQQGVDVTIWIEKDILFAKVQDHQN